MHNKPNTKWSTQQTITNAAQTYKPSAKTHIDLRRVGVFALRQCFCVGLINLRFVYDLVLG